MSADAGGTLASQDPPVFRGGGRAGKQRVRKLAVKDFHPVTKLATDRVTPEGLKPSR